MVGVSFALADFVTGGPIVDLPIMEGAKWSALLNRPDSLSCTIDMRDPDALALDLRSASTLKKSLLIARTETKAILAWGIVNGDREWSEEDRTLSISATGIEGAWLDNAIVGPVAALTEPLLVDGAPNAALDTTLSGYSLGTIGKKLIEQRLAWPGSPIVFSLPPDEDGDRERLFEFLDFASVAKRLGDLRDVENGPDFAFDAGYGPDDLFLVYTLRHGSEETPRIGTYAGLWNLGGETPISEFVYRDAADDFASAVWMTAGRTSGVPLISRALNEGLIADGYPPYDYVDKSRSTVELADTLDAYARAAAEIVATPEVSVSFSVQGEPESGPALGNYRPGDTVTLGVPGSHPWIENDLTIRITSMSGDETGKTVKIGCEVVS